MEPKIAIITINWNGYDRTKTCVDSLLALTYTNYKIYVVDNASDHHEGQRLHDAYLGNQRVTVIQHSQNAGYAGGNNVGLQRARTEGWANGAWFINNDATVHPQSLSHLVYQATTNTQLGAIGSLIVYPDERTVYALGGGTFSSWTGIDHLLGARQPRRSADQPKRKLQYISGAALFLTSAALAVINGFDEEYFLYSEELDLCIRLQRTGLTLDYEPQALVIHESSATTGHFSSTYIYYFLRNRLVLMQKQIAWYQRATFLLFYFGYYVLGFIALLVVRGQMSKLGYVLRAVSDGWLHRVGRRDLSRV